MDFSYHSRISRSATYSAITMVLLAVGLVGTVFVTQQQQDNRSRAAGTFTMGTTTVGSSTKGFGGNTIICNKYPSAYSGTLTSISASLGSTSWFGSKSYAFAVYTDLGGNPGTLLAKTGTGSINANAWNTLSLSTQVTAGMSYWLCYNHNGSSSSYNNMRYTTGTIQSVYKSQSFGTWPATFGTPSSTFTGVYSLYASGGVAPVTPTVAPTLTPTSLPPTHTPTPTPTAVVMPTPTVALPTLAQGPSVVPTSTPYPTATPMPNATQFVLNLFLHGVGRGGDSSSTQSVGVMTPVRPQRPVTVEVFDTQNQLVAAKQGTVSFASETGTFTGAVDMGTLASGMYTVKVRVPQYLRSSVPGIVSVTSGTVNQLAPTPLVAGDVNNDNALNIMDYNVLMGCYSDLSAAVNCTDETKVASDMTDDGFVNMFDYNLFIRELNNRTGQ